MTPLATGISCHEPCHVDHGSTGDAWSASLSLAISLPEFAGARIVDADTLIVAVSSRGGFELFDTATGRLVGSDPLLDAVFDTGAVSGIRIRGWGDDLVVSLLAGEPAPATTIRIPVSIAALTQQLFTLYAAAERQARRRRCPAVPVRSNRPVRPGVARDRAARRNCRMSRSASRSGSRRSRGRFGERACPSRARGTQSPALLPVVVVLHFSVLGPGQPRPDANAVRAYRSRSHAPGRKSIVVIAFVLHDARCAARPGVVAGQVPSSSPGRVARRLGLAVRGRRRPGRSRGRPAR